MCALVGWPCWLLVLLSGCTAAEGGPASAPPSTASGPSVPVVADPLDLGAYEPCDLIGVEDLGIIGYGQDATATVFTDDCSYEGGGRSGSLTVKLYVDESPLSAAYERDAKTYEKFEPREILGYPAVVEAEKIADGTCIVLVGTADDQGVMLLKYPDVGAKPENHDAACTLLTLAETMLHNLGV